MEEISEIKIPNSSSVEPTVVLTKLDYKTTGNDRLVSILYKKVEVMEKEIHELKTQKIIDETQIPIEILESNGMLPFKKRRLTRGRGYRPILQSEIEEAQKHNKFCSRQAEYLGITLITYRKYCKMYGLWNPNPNQTGRRNIFDPDRGTYPLNKILVGEFYDNLAVDDWLVKDKLVRSGKVPIQCNICGYNKRRIVDNKLSLLLDHKDGDSRNYKLDNLQLLCLNCTFECGRGYIRRGKHMFDPDWMQGAEIHEIDPVARF